MRTFVLLLLTLVAIPRGSAADVTADERALLQRLDVSRTLALMKQLSDDIVTNRSGAAAGTAVAGSAD